MRSCAMFNHQPSPVLAAKLVSLALLFWFGLFSSLSAQATPAASKPKLAIVIDDMGYRPYPAEFHRLPAAISLAIIPNTPHAQMVAETGDRDGRNILIHMPMQPARHAPLEPHTLLETMNVTEFNQQLDNAIVQLPQAIGMNNHMGSLLTAKPQQMEWVMRKLSHHGMHFLDSATTVDSVARQRADQFAVANLKRHIFIDHFQDETFIVKQLKLAAEVASKHGYAIAIGHPHPLTLTTLHAVLPQLDVELVPIATLWQRYGHLNFH